MRTQHREAKLLLKVTQQKAGLRGKCQKTRWRDPDGADKGNSDLNL